MAEGNSLQFHLFQGAEIIYSFGFVTSIEVSQFAANWAAVIATIASVYVILKKPQILTFCQYPQNAAIQKKLKNSQ